MRYAQSGGLTDAERAAREPIRLQAVVRFEAGRSRLSETQIARLERGTLVHNRADRRWTPARIKTLIGRLFHVSCTVEGT
ncbi:hypothetical protein OG255_33570 [Streptomyces sp. NBC_01455]|nr:hypothetical protein [Streptomyces sp. NBC_01455]